MSTMLMGLCWPLRMSSTLKTVLISLADNANDQGYCWPAIGTICERTCLSERAVRNSLRALEALGLVKTDIGAMKSNRYVLTVREYLATLEPEKSPAPRHVVPPGTSCPPARGAPTPGTTCPLTVIEPIPNTPLTPVSGGKLAFLNSSVSGSGSKNSAKAGDEAKPASKPAPLALKTWLLQCRELGQKPVPPDAPVFRYADTVGIGRELLELCWREFKRRNEAANKRQRDWRRTFQNCVEGNWYGLWFLPAGEPAKLASKGEQAQRYWAALDLDAGRAAAANDDAAAVPSESNAA